MLPYIFSLVGGVGVGLTVATDRTLTALRREQSDLPSLAPGGWLRRRYIETMVLSVAMWIAVAVYLVIDPHESYIVVLAAAGFVTYIVFKELEPSIQKRFGNR